MSLYRLTQNTFVIKKSDYKIQHMEKMKVGLWELRGEVVLEDTLEVIVMELVIGFLLG